MGAYQDRRVFVTGAGRGIGAALARRFAAEGAAVAVNDLDADAAQRTAKESGGLALPGDAAAPDEVAALIDRAEHDLGGGIDVYCANAGVGTGGGPEAPEADWALAWEVNVMAHVRAARVLVPRWLERGGGRFVATVSAAGLLTMVGAAPYSVTKHAALAHAEWLSVTYRHRGIAAHAVCPQGVRTDMLAATGQTGQIVLAPGAIEPERVADAVLDGIAAERFLILPHPEVAGYYTARATDPDAWLAGMNKLQRKVEDGR
ncbi:MULTISPECIES: SDR family oxidoreductase [Streptomycetaceae]|uniref:Oxidoreductase n=1 Tax=Streptantibioticus cattleyicolor (strain ATCC 35852 / DSM 46488 / JCM 4925 / NBRC 14057 / NRRL 8057) TaxID=1003195 RepID=F8JX01_STREN|nr:SDR family oxidoreductase [Streptantibioticus cattleyicolor]AEW93271.1 oxidoreductase [Streptantibioticus cattleyicolor NRRL 8057 = DSM 46488]MYS57992.1 SDR family NAD(P)-dependent oxidoreductase [Streptomyces sp. SID5468]CCB73631.1 putative oxidoreductase [Streptantibioticus cattleyicolor NRRL 8057 = DSM 46488]